MRWTNLLQCRQKVRAPWEVCADQQGWRGKLCEAPVIKKVNQQLSAPLHQNYLIKQEMCTGRRMWYVQTPCRCCWQRSLEPSRSSLVLVWGFPHTVTACTCSSSRGRCLWACQRFLGPQGCPDSPYRNTWERPETPMNIKWESVNEWFAGAIWLKVTESDQPCYFLFKNNQNHHKISNKVAVKSSHHQHPGLWEITPEQCLPAAAHFTAQDDLQPSTAHSAVRLVAVFIVAIQRLCEVLLQTLTMSSRSIWVVNDSCVSDGG